MYHGALIVGQSDLSGCAGGDMKFLGEQKALDRLKSIKEDLRREVADGYEYRAKSCLTCETKGACCLDAHFVNVHISRIESKAILKFLSTLPDEHQEKLRERIELSIERFGLNTDGDTFSKTYACPMFEKGIGCLIHDAGKPVPCIMHACYENQADLPPDELQSRAEQIIDDLNEDTYGRSLPLLPLPVAIANRS